ncbi:serine-rich coiled-coil domain-containing protein 1-like isoform X2 [Polyodon spathula]|uniref:serine-rich coiled-coil domain-containing protein 1-like isoform X2 n=1 Tax=Polyodon spathula TaxID=7913 RepID=UPI001B7EF23A|nr:serine-rich coiled-coil domain-containing protein 1-like isoform X2 [Polyodon spathula]
MSPASSVHSLPVSPGTEKQLLSKDVTKGERSSLMLQLKEKDDLILKLQDELAKAQSLEKSVSHRMDKSTQTEIIGHDPAEDAAISDDRQDRGNTNAEGLLQRHHWQAPAFRGAQLRRKNLLKRGKKNSL